MRSDLSEAGECSCELIASKIFAAENIAVLSHLRPDADCIGSGLALCMMLRQLGKKVVFRNPDPVPHPLTRLPGIETLEQGQIGSGAYDLLIGVEGTSSARTGHKGVENFYRINIDHHVTGKKDADINWIEPQAAAVGEMIYRLGLSLGIEFTRDICFNLYAALSSDTGSMKYSNTTGTTLNIASELVKRGGFEPWEVTDLLFYSNPVEKILLTREILNTMELHLDERVVLIRYEKSFSDNTDIAGFDVEDIIFIPRSIDGVKITLFFKETEKNLYRVSVRSKEDYNAQVIAGRFDGGGHDHAAGFFCEGSFEFCRDKVLAIIDELYRGKNGRTNSNK